MANALTALAPVAYSAAREVAAEPTGVIGAINTTFDDKGVSLNDTIYVPVAPTRSATDYTPAMTTTAGTDATATSIGVTISASKHVSWHITGEQQRSLENGDTDKDWFAQLLKQGMRDLRNKAELAAWTAASLGASRAYGTAATTPFASDLSALTNARKILEDNGAPLSDMSLVVDTSAALNLRNLGVLQNAYQAGSDAERRSGNFLPQMGFDIRTSAQVTTHTAGTAASATTDNAGYAVGTTTLTLASAGTGTILAGDVITFAGDSNKYVVVTGDADVSGGGTIVIAEPGLRVAMSAATKAITMVATFTGNLALERSSVVGIIRPPLIPASPLISQLPVSDDKGMTYLLCDIVGDGMRTLRLHLCYGFKAVNTQFAAIVLG